MGFFNKMKKNREEEKEQWKNMSKKEKFTRGAIVGVILLVIAISNMGGDDDESKDTAKSEQTSKKEKSIVEQIGMKSGVSYEFSKVCTPSNNKYCLTRAEQIELCSSDYEITSGAIDGIGLSNHVFDALYKGGIGWKANISQNNDRPCTIRVRTSGIYRGTSTNIAIITEPQLWFLSENNKPRVRYLDYLYEE